MSASFVAYIISYGISFFLSPYIVKNVGVAAYGFVGLANNFISYASLITIALNSMAGRFVTIKIYEKDSDGTNRHFSSIFTANLILALIMSVIGFFVVFFLEKLIQIPSNILPDVKILFLMLFLKCILSTIGSTFAIATFATNKLYIDSMRQTESNILRLVIIVALFLAFEPKVCYIGITSFVTGFYAFGFNIYYTKKLLPDVKIRKNLFDIKAVLEIVSSGVWNLITKLGMLLQDGLDLLITNIFIGAVSMGVLSLAKTIPAIITGIVGTLVGIFMPHFTILYAEKKQSDLVKAVKQSMKIMGILATLPIVVLIVCGKEFFALWQPTQDANQLHILSLLTCAGLIFNGGISCINNVFTVVNKLKVNSIVICITGIISMGIVFVLLKTTDLGIYAVAGVSTVVVTVKNLVFTVPYGARCLKQKWYEYYPDVARPAVFVAASSIICIFIKNIIFFNGWLGLFVMSAVTAAISCAIGMFVVLNKNDRAILKARIIRKK